MILLNGATQEYKGDCKYWLKDRHLDHEHLNELVKNTVSDFANTYIVDVNKYITSSDLYLDTLNHYQKSVYYQIAQEIQQFTEKTGNIGFKTKSKKRVMIESSYNKTKALLRKILRGKKGTKQK